MKLFSKLLYLLAFLCSVTALWLANGGYVVLAKVFYPFHYREEIVASAKEFKLDPLFVVTVIREESRFRPDIRSHAGAVGLMQLLPSTASWGARKLHLRGFQPDQLIEPKVNIRLGCWYLRYLLEHFGGAEMVLAAYNGGEGNAVQWFNPEKQSFPETREYVRRGKATYQMYRRLYGHGEPPIPWFKPLPVATGVTPSATGSGSP